MPERTTHDAVVPPPAIAETTVLDKQLNGGGSHSMTLENRVNAAANVTVSRGAPSCSMGKLSNDGRGFSSVPVSSVSQQHYSGRIWRWLLSPWVPITDRKRVREPDAESAKGERRVDDPLPHMKKKPRAQ